MSELDWRLAAAFAAGAALGLFYFGALWLTVQRLPRSANPYGLALLSFVARMAVLLAGIYLVMQGRWERAVACLAGLLAARTAMILWLRPRQGAANARKEAPHGRR